MMQKSCDVVPYQKSPQKHKCMESVCPLYLEATTFERFHTDAVPKFIHRWRCRYFPDRVRHASGCATKPLGDFFRISSE